jgi:hypothetical protein
MTRLRWLVSVVGLAALLTATPAVAGGKFFFSFGFGHGFHHGFHKPHPPFRGHFFFGKPHWHRFGHPFIWHGHPRFFHDPFWPHHFRHPGVPHRHFLLPHGWQRW